MRIRVGYEIGFELAAPTPMIVMLYTHPSVEGLLDTRDRVLIEPDIPLHEYLDAYGNRCGRLMAPAGSLTLRSESFVEDSGEYEKPVPDALQHAVEDLPDEVLLYLLSSRYCEVDKLSDIAWRLFSDTPLGWSRVQAVCDWVHSHVRFDYQLTHPSKSALDVYNEATGVCRDFQHLAITFCRALNIPARYATGWLTDIGVSVPDSPMDFSAWFEVYLGGKWHTFDARNNQPRIGRILVATGRDAVDCGAHYLVRLLPADQIRGRWRRGVPPSEPPPVVSQP